MLIMTKPLLAILLLLNLGLANLYVSTAHSAQISISSGGVDIHYEVHGEGEPTFFLFTAGVAIDPIGRRKWSTLPSNIRS